MRTILFFIFVFWGYGFPAFAFFQGRTPILGAIIILLGVVWMVAYRTRWFRYNLLGLVLGVVSNGYAIWFFPQPGLLIISTTLTLAAWDLARFEQRLLLASLEDSLSRISQRHLFHLSVFILSAVLLSYGAIQWRVKIHFWVAIVLMVITFIGLIQLVKTLLETER